MPSRCYLCGGKTRPDHVTAENWWGNSLALVENVPAWVCQTCGEVYFDAETAEQLDDLRRSNPKRQREVHVPVYAFPEPSRR